MKKSNRSRHVIIFILALSLTASVVYGAKEVYSIFKYQKVKFPITLKTGSYEYEHVYRPDGTLDSLKSDGQIGIYYTVNKVDAKNVEIKVEGVATYQKQVNLVFLYVDADFDNNHQIDESEMGVLVASCSASGGGISLINFKDIPSNLKPGGKLIVQNGQETLVDGDTDFIQGDAIVPHFTLIATVPKGTMRARLEIKNANNNAIEYTDEIGLQVAK